MGILGRKSEDFSDVPSQVTLLRSLRLATAGESLQVRTLEGVLLYEMKNVEDRNPVITLNVPLGLYFCRIVTKRGIKTVKFVVH